MKIQWPPTIILIVVLILVATAYLAGPALGVPPESHAQFVASVAAGCSILLSLLSPIVVKVLSKDTDGDGLPDAFDRKTPVGLAEELEGEDSP